MNQNQAPNKKEGNTRRSILHDIVNNKKQSQRKKGDHGGRLLATDDGILWK